MEAEVTVKCRKSDEQLVRSIVEPAIEEYKAIMQKEVKAFHGKEVPIRVIIDEKRFLPEYSENEANESCMGGIVLHCRKGRIVCSNTLDERLQLCY
jgi:vacuolar-type H+-ATPase subunit E/Vma4